MIARGVERAIVFSIWALVVGWVLLERAVGRVLCRS